MSVSTPPPIRNLRYNVVHAGLGVEEASEEVLERTSSEKYVFKVASFALVIWSSSPLRSGDLFRLASSSHHVHGAGASRAGIECGLVRKSRAPKPVHSIQCDIFGIRVLNMNVPLFYTQMTEHTFPAFYFVSERFRSFLRLSDFCA